MPDVKPAPKGGSTGGFLTAKSGPLPNWAWGAIVLGGALGYSLYKNHKASTTASTSSTTATQNTPGTNATGSGLTPSVIVQNMGGGSSSTPPTTLNLTGSLTTENATPGTGGTPGSTQGAMYPITAAQAATLLMGGSYPFVYQNGNYVRVGEVSKTKSVATKSLQGKGQLYAGPDNYASLTGKKS